VETQLKANEALTESLSQMSLTDENSPAILTEPPSNSLDTLVTDFQRALEADELFVNGKPLSEYAADFHDFAHPADVVQFMRKVILKDVHWRKGKMLSYMQEKLHNDGLLRPVTSALQEAMVEHSNTSEKPYRVATISDSTCKRRVEIASSKIGFSIQETLSVDKLHLEPIPHKGEESSLYRASKDKATLSAEIEGSPIVSARGAVQVNFYSGNPGGRPALTPVENTITYGHRTLAEKMTLLRKEKEHRLTQSSEEGLTDTESRSSTPRLDDSER
ncbi:MAG: hypothetical protein P1U32_05600, partial [Legionellaceae bacterium]|nr:hypothetical protein [Legionellaceae bacterium]